MPKQPQENAEKSVWFKKGHVFGEPERLEPLLAWAKVLPSRLVP